MEESLSRDLRRIEISAPPLKCYQTPEPLLHIMRELRNLEFHLTSSPLNSEKRKVKFGRMSRAEEASDFEHEAFFIKDISVAGFKQLRNARHYKEEDIVRLLQWFKEAQRAWGIDDLVVRAVTRYSELIIEKYQL